MEGSAAEVLFWGLIAELRVDDSRVGEGTLMGGRCARVGGEFLALADFQGSGMVVKLPPARVAALIAQGVGEPFAPAGRTFREWVAIPKPEPELWTSLLREAVDHVSPRRTT